MLVPSGNIDRPLKNFQSIACSASHSVGPVHLNDAELDILEHVQVLLSELLHLVNP